MMAMGSNAESIESGCFSILKLPFFLVIFCNYMEYIDGFSIIGKYRRQESLQIQRDTPPTSRMSRLDDEEFFLEEERINGYTKTRIRPEDIVRWHDRSYHLFGNASRAYRTKFFRDDHHCYLAYEHFFGIRRHVFQEYVSCLHAQSNKEASAWWIQGSTSWEALGGNYKNWTLPDKDTLFIQGLGKFDIEGTYFHIVNRRLMIHKEEVLKLILDFFGELPSGLEGLDPYQLLETCDLDQTFHTTLQVYLEQKKLQVKNQAIIRQVQKRLLFQEVIGDPIGNVCWHSHYETIYRPRPPFWYVNIPYLWVQGYFPELLPDDQRLHNPRKDESLRQVLHKRITLRDKRGTDWQTIRNIANILASDGGAIFWRRRGCSPKPREHFIQYIDKWKECEFQSLYELSKVATTQSWWAKSSLRSKINCAWPNNGLTLLPEQLVEALERERLALVPSNNMTFLKDLPDTDQLKVLRSPLDIYTNNLEDVDTVLNKYSIYVAWYDPDKKDQKSHAIGKFTLSSEFLWTRVKIDTDTEQYYLDAWNKGGEKYDDLMKRPGNTKYTQKALRVFQEYTPIIEKWLRLELEKGTKFPLMQRY